jgi:hypothetical protein
MTLRYAHLALDYKLNAVKKNAWELQAINYLICECSLSLNQANFSNTTTAFTFTMDVDVERKLNPLMQVGVGYGFSDWGGRAFGQSLNTGVSLSH